MARITFLFVIFLSLASLNSASAQVRKENISGEEYQNLFNRGELITYKNESKDCELRVMYDSDGNVLSTGFKTDIGMFYPKNNHTEFADPWDANTTVTITLFRSKKEIQKYVGLVYPENIMVPSPDEKEKFVQYKIPDGQAPLPANYCMVKIQAKAPKDAIFTEYQVERSCRTEWMKHTTTCRGLRN